MNFLDEVPQDWARAPNSQSCGIFLCWPTRDLGLPSSLPRPLASCQARSLSTTICELPGAS